MEDTAAPIHAVGTARIVSVEHPCIIRNFENGIKSLGGEAQLKHVLEHHVDDTKLSSKQNHLPEPVAGVSLRPNDPFAKKIASTACRTRNVLVRVTVPKRTGRKRKRASDDPFQYQFQEPERPERQDAGITAPQLVQRLRDNEGKYHIEAVGMLRETHRFRTLPDFQLRSADLAVMHKLRDNTMMPDYDKLAHFRIRTDVGNHDITAHPAPPTFTSFDMPHKYEYQQASGVVYVQDESGQVTAKNISAAPKRVTWGLAPDAPEIPQKAPVGLPRRSPTGELLPKAVKELQKLLETRPLLTKRVALNSMAPISDTIFKEAMQYVGYSFKAGPWRDSLIKYGVDPRKDPKCRFYQTLMFQVDREAFKDVADEKGKFQASSSSWARPLRHTRDAPESHIFDGKTVTANGKTWQVCDVTDPIVKEIFDTENIREDCDPFQWGWYHSGTLAKARTIMKDKMRFLFAKEDPPVEDYKHISKIPDRLTKDNMTEALLAPNTHGYHACSLANEVRNIVKSGEGTRSAEKLWAQKRKAVGEADGDDNVSAADGQDAAELRDLDVADDDEGDLEENRDEVFEGEQVEASNNMEHEH
ncbi:hypothetical protein AC578_5882 [Pseudocercospora eumusae]|uniref:Transcription factor IIIC subunit 5 HTH domain-containing protein n=1 Tax=Pseudocercospora eumusae TaxID=321146 RepID=A0A139HD04_9PEZI|nr:hypothetical protein AC578_5882 [Pseudocercospora eumusae]